MLFKIYSKINRCTPFLQSNQLLIFVRPGWHPWCQIEDRTNLGHLIYSRIINNKFSSNFFFKHIMESKLFSDAKSVLRNYILSPDICIDNYQPKILSWQSDIRSLFEVEECPASTDLVMTRDLITGKVIDFIEVFNENAEETAENSASFKRIPNPPEEAVRGSIFNCPFWPGGIDKPIKNEIDDLKIDLNFNFNEKLLTIPPDFEEGYNFENKLDENKCDLFNDDDNTKINLIKSLENTSEFEEWLINENNEENNQEYNDKNLENIKNMKNTENDNIFSNIPIIEISKSDSTIPSYLINSKAQWAEVVDITQPVDDFERKIPNPAKIWNFELDPFQKQAIIKVENHQYVFVAAHTSAGKTVVAEYAIALSKRHMTRTIYTSPIKALSNQKYRDFRKEFKDVGLITGDMQIEPQASCLVMTTEILRSMLYCGSDVTRDLEFVILDEVHYINDNDRGHVWEEVLILLPDHVTVIMLSATVPNTIEFADWVGNIKKRKVYVISTFKRPVPLMHYIYLTQLNKTSNKLKDHLFCIVDSESKFLSTNYSDCEHKLNLKKVDNTLKKNKSCEHKFSSKKKDNAIKRNKNYNSNSEVNLWNTLIRQLQNDQKLPVIVFVLSRKRCDDIAQMLHVDLNTQKEHDQFHLFFNLCLKKLKTSDQDLPQLLWMKHSLERGIGVHHSGILPILKEIVEMCFQRGLVKVLFATETFAMGVNMPAKTVVFDSITKFDGIDTRRLNPAEYIQMAGRAGRRGHDDNGTVIILCKNDKLPNSIELRSMILGKPDQLTSKFVLRYAVLLTCLRTESVKVENIVTHSYLEYYKKQSIPQHEKQLEIEKENLNKLKELDDNLKPLCDFYDIGIQYIEKRQVLMKKILLQPKISKELVPGRVLIVSHGSHYNKLGILLQMKSSIIKVLVLDNPKDSESTNKDKQNDDKWNKFLSLTSHYKYFDPENIGGHCIIDINPSDIIQITKQIIKCDNEQIIQNWNQRQMERFRNDPPHQKVLQAIAELNTLNNLYISDGLQFFNLNEYHDIDISDSIDALNELKFQLDNILPYTNIANFENDFDIVYKRKSLIRKISDLEWKKSWKSLSLYPDYCNRLNVLKELGFINQDEEVDLRGKIACEMGQNEIILTELVYNNIIHGLDTAEIAALLSSLVFQGQTKQNTEPKMTPNLEKAIEDMKNINMKIQECEMKYNVTQMERRERLNFGLVDVVYQWARDKPFAQIMELTDVQEGIIVRCIQQLDEIVRDVKTAAKRIGDPTLESKMDEVSTAIRRDIVFAASLYTTLNE